MKHFVLTVAQQKTILELARSTIAHCVMGLELPTVDTDQEPLRAKRGVFVTLHLDGQLRGCIGTLTGSSGLLADVRDMAIAASTEDPRFNPLRLSELDKISIEVSVLSPLVRIGSADEILLGEHGVLVRSGYRSGVYLPQVAKETGWSKEEFMSSLCAHKAGLEPGAWKTGSCQMYVFRTQVFGE